MTASQAERLTVSIPGGLELDMGSLRVAPEARAIEPPEVSLYDQVVAFLDVRPPALPWKPREFRRLTGAATALVCVRWSSWLALLADPERPLWHHAGDPDVSAIADPEMARINIEASYALECWVDLFRSDRSRWEQLAAKALVHLPPAGRIPPAARVSPLLIVAHPGVPALVASWPEEGRARGAAQALANPTRVFANAAVLVGYRNGPVEDVHGGQDESLPLTHRRVAPADERAIVASAAAELAVAMGVVDVLGTTGAPWNDAVMPFALPFPPWSEATRWSTTERSRRVVLS
ncbi:MAG: hypothetical protein V4850_01410 [Myxococcota bacterium]